MRQLNRITDELEKQTKKTKSKQLNALKRMKKNQISERDPLRLCWKDVLIFGLLIVFCGGYYCQIDAYQQTKISAHNHNKNNG